MQSFHKYIAWGVFVLMVARTSMRLVWRYFVQNRMGDMSSKIRMPSPEEALPGREQSMKVSGMALWICLTFTVHVLSRLSAVKTKAVPKRFKSRWHGYSLIRYRIGTEAYLCKRKLRRVLCGRGNGGLCFVFPVSVRRACAVLHLHLIVILFILDIQIASICWRYLLVFAYSMINS